jgi:hypothetical protein
MPISVKLFPDLPRNFQPMSRDAKSARSPAKNSARHEFLLVKTPVRRPNPGFKRRLGHFDSKILLLIAKK